MDKKFQLLQLQYGTILNQEEANEIPFQLYKKKLKKNKKTTRSNSLRQCPSQC